MTRLQEIADLRRRYQEAVEARKWKTASLLHARLLSLMTRQLNAENKAAKRRTA
jgi:hypothetical protein